jgi:hypothetical protein
MWVAFMNAPCARRSRIDGAARDVAKVWRNLLDNMLAARACGDIHER